MSLSGELIETLNAMNERDTCDAIALLAHKYPPSIWLDDDEDDPFIHAAEKNVECAD